MSSVLRVPGALAVLLTSLFAQIPVGALGLLLVLHTRDVTGTYAAGGAVTAAFGLALGVSNPLLGRIADRRGPVAVLVLCAPLSTAAIVAQALLGDGVPVWVRVVLAAVAGAFQPPVGALRRRVWNVLVPDPDLRHRAYATEGVLAEFVYLLGPIAIVSGLGSLSVPGALIFCGAAITVGNVAFARLPVVRTLAGAPVADGAEPHGLLGALRAPGVVVAMLVYATLGITVGAVEVGVPAALEDMGDRGLTGLALGVWGVGSMLAAVVVARSAAPARPVRRLALLVGAWGALHGVLALAGTPLLLVVALFAAGATISPALTVFNGILDRLALPGTLTEAVTWTSTGMMVGMAAGGAVAGHLADATSPAAGLALGATAVVGAGLLVAARAVMRGGVPPAGPRAADATT
ncbi:MFS transporter [Patulibacter sp. SYSU D01012]|uniref:MFS transporter n=1 Tax=Patulibacter sp. SYSU D01012 TaxID=2817381 RepID=UPI001B3180E2|nr:MFS transporter [Patulibacter sp. SYSU D01012]